VRSENWRAITQDLVLAGRADDAMRPPRR